MHFCEGLPASKRVFAMDREGGQGQKRPRCKKTQPSSKPSHVSDEGDCSSPSPASQSKKRSKGPRDPSPSMLEDIIDGFAIQSFRTQDDLEVTIFYAVKY